MSNKKNKKIKKNPNSLGKYNEIHQNKEINLLLVKYFKEISIIMMLAVAGFFAIAFFSYNNLDPGWSRTGQHLIISNMAGSFGAWWADLCLYFLGVVAYLLPIVLVYFAIIIFNVEQYNNSISLWAIRFFGLNLTLFSSTGLISLLNQQLNFINSKLPVSVGGVVGDFISSYLYQKASFWGGGVILLYCLLAGLTALIGISWLNVGKLLYYFVKLLGLFIIKIVKFNYFWLKNIVLIVHEKITKWNKKQGAVLTNHHKSSMFKHRNLVIRGIELFYSMIKGSKWLQYQNHLIKFRSIFSKNIVNSTQAIKPVTGSGSVLASEEIILKQRKAAKKFIQEIQQNQATQSNIVTNPNLKHNKPKNTNYFGLPLLDLLEKSNIIPAKEPKENLPDPHEIQTKLADFGILVKIVGIFPGPVVTRVELELAPGTKASKITGLSKDLARSLSVPSVRVVEVIPGKSVVGLEIPNKHRVIVRLKELIAAEQYTLSNSPITLALGKGISGIPIVADLAKMPHLLVAGTTGSGKSVGVNAMLLSILFKATPEEVRLILIDPKMLELSIYDGIPHLLTPVVTDMKDAANALNWCVFEMERRYKLMASLGVRNLLSFNLKVQTAINSRNPIVNPLYNTNFPEGPNNKKSLEKLPYIVVIIDEFADMMMVVGKKVEEQISRIAQKARAAGIHMILATQRPSVDVITGLIKANIPTRIAFQVSSRIDSRTILDQQGAEQLLGHGDLLYLPPGSGIPIRVHGAFVSDEEVHKVVDYLKNIEYKNNLEQINLNHMQDNSINNITEDNFGDEADPLYTQAVAIVTSSKKASISYLQRRLKIGFNRAARLIEEMQHQGIVVTQSNGVREVLVKDNAN